MLGIRGITRIIWNYWNNYGIIKNQGISFGISWNRGITRGISWNQGITRNQQGDSESRRSYS